MLRRAGAAARTVAHYGAVVWPPIMGTVVELPIIAPEVVPYIMLLELGLPIMLLGVVVSDSGHPTAVNASSTTSSISTSVVPRLLPFIGSPFARPHRAERF